MDDTKPQGLTVTAKIALALIALFLILGLITNGISIENWQRMWRNFVERPTGPMMFRFVLQPTLAVIAALKDGLRDARTGRSPYFWTILNDPQRRMARLNEGLVSTARIILMALIMDTIYQLKVSGTFYPGESVWIAIILAFLPYLVLRGPISRIARRWSAAGAAAP